MITPEDIEEAMKFLTPTMLPQVENAYLSPANFAKLSEETPHIMNIIQGIQVIADSTVPDDCFIMTTPEGFAYYKAFRQSGLSHEEAIAKFNKTKDGNIQKR